MTPLRRDWPVVVVGAGPTGLTLASLLARYDIQVLLIERNATTVQEPRAVSIDDEALRTMQAAGLVDAVLAEVVLGYGSHYFSSAGRCFLRVNPTTVEYGYPRRNAFRQPVLEAQLRAHVARQAAAEIRFGCELIGFAQTGYEVTLRVRAADGSESEIGCRYLVGCDGAKSLIRQSLGIALQGSTFRERWLIVDLEETNDPTRDTKVFCNPARPAISLPGPARTRRFEFMLRDDETDAQALEPANISSLLRLYGKDDACPIRRKAVYTFHARLAERWNEGRVFLAGDAAHLTPPFAGQGMNSGIRDAHNLAWKLAAVVQGRLGPRLLRTYELERRDHAWNMIQLAMRMGHVMMPRTRAAALAMDLGFRLLGLFPTARDYFAQMKYKPKPRFHEGFVLPSGRIARKHAMVGMLFPQPRVETPESHHILLDEVLGQNFALVAPPGTDAALIEQLPADLSAPLAIRRLAVLRADEAFSGRTSAACVRDSTGALARMLDGHPPGLLLLRPDHYVAAFLPAEDITAAAHEIRMLLAQTWSKEDRGGSIPEAPLAA